MCQLRTVACLASLLLLASVASAQQDVINTFAGGGPNNLPATSANVPQAQAVATDAFGNYYIASNGSVNNPPESRVFKVNSSGTLTLFAGNGFQGYSGDGGPALQAELNYPSGVAADSFGNVYIADTNNCVIRKVDSSGTITTFAGTPNVCNFGGDGGFATSAYLSYPNGVAVDSYGNVYIADTNNFRIREVTISNGEINTVAGGYNCTSGGAACGDGGPAIGAGVSYVYSLALDGSNNIYITDYYNYSIREFSVGGNINTVAGNGTWCGSGGAACGDGGAATSAELSHVLAVAVDSPGNIFIADRDNYSVREVTVSNHIINTVAGGYNCYLGGLACGDGGAATSAGLSQVYGLAVDTSDDIFIADYSNYGIREVTNTNGTTKPVSGNINTVAGDGTFSFAGNGVPPLNASLYQPSGVTSDSSGNIYIADQTNEVVREVNATTGNITTIAGTPGVFGYFGDGGEATAAELYYPNKVAVYEGNVYIADTFNCVIRLVDTSGTIATFAGVPQECGPGTDGGPATSSKLYYPYGVAVDSSGNVYIADQGDQSIRMVSGGIITTVAGMGYGHQGYSGDGGPATSAELYYPVDVAVDSAGNLYIADSNNAVVRMVNTAGIISTIAGGGTGCLGETDSVGDGCPATAASLSNLQGVAVDAAGDVLIADTYNNRIRWVDGLGIIHSVAGDGTYDFSGDGGPATSATLADPWGVGLDPSGNIYIADYRNFQVRLVNAVAALNASTTSLTFGPQAVGTPSSPQTVTLAAVGPLDISNIVFTGDFSSPDDCVTGPMSGQCVMSIVFTPTGTGTRQGTVTISDNGYFSSSLVINLQGTGTALSTPTITFGTAPSPTYGGGNFVVNASTSSNGTLTFGAYSGPCGLVSSTATTATFSSSAAGTCVVQASVAATSTYSAGSAQQAVTISQASQTITFTTLAPPTEVYMGTFPVAATASSGLTVTLTVDASSTSVCSLAGSTVTMNSGTGTCTIDANQSGNTNYGTAPQVQTSATATKATPTVTWSTPPPASAVYNSQFTVVATSNSTGAITYSTSGGCSNTLGVVTMTSGTTACQVSASAAADANYTTGSVGPTSVSATLASQTITFTTPAPPTEVYKGTFPVAATASSGLTVTLTVDASSTSVCSLVAGTVTMNSGTGTCTIDANQSGNTNYSAAPQVQTSATATKATPTVTWSTPPPASAVYNSQFTVVATTNSTGAITYSTSGGCSNNAGVVTMTSGTTACQVSASAAADANYTTGSVGPTSVTATLATPTITFSAAPSATYPGPNFTVSATTNSNGALTYSYVSGPCTQVSGGTFSPTGVGTCVVQASTAATTNFTAGSATQSVTITAATKITPTITWPTPEPITYGMPLSSKQLDATANVPGRFVYDPPAGTILTAGTHTLSVTFTPTNTTAYTTATATVTIQVNQAVPPVVWVPIPTVYGTPLGPLQLDAFSPVPGTFVYNPPAGTILHAGEQTLSATFTPKDTTDYETIKVTATLIVLKAVPVITWPQPAPITVGTPLSSKQLDATANVPGTFVYSPAAGAVLPVGRNVLKVTFTPNDTTDYTTATAEVVLTVLEE